MKKDILSNTNKNTSTLNTFFYNTKWKILLKSNDYRVIINDKRLLDDVGRHVLNKPQCDQHILFQFTTH